MSSKNKIRRINFFGGPGSAKSTTAAWLFAELKTRHISVELVMEFVKKFAYEKRPVDEFDQIYLLGKQMDSEYRFLKAGVEYIITDSPVLLSAVYSQVYYENLNIAPNIYDIVKEYDAKYPPLNIFLNRKNREYDPRGRYQTKDEAINIDNTIKTVFEVKKIPVAYFNYDDRGGILDFIIDKI